MLVINFMFCSNEVGGNDQTGNIVSGHELISRVQDVPVWGEYQLL